MQKTHNTLPEEIRVQSVDQQLWFVESHLAPKQVDLARGK